MYTGRGANRGRLGHVAAYGGIRGSGLTLHVRLVNQFICVDIDQS